MSTDYSACGAQLHVTPPEGVGVTSLNVWCDKPVKHTGPHGAGIVWESGHGSGDRIAQSAATESRVGAALRADLRAKAEAANGIDQWWPSSAVGVRSDAEARAFIAAATPRRVLALIDDQAEREEPSDG